MLVNLRAGVLAIAFLALISCKGAGQAPGPFRELAFNVDSTKLGERLKYQGVECRLPRGWMAAEAEAMSAIRRASQQDTSLYALNPEHVFHDSLGAVLVLSTYRNFPERVTDFLTFGQNYGTGFRASRAGLENSEEWLKLGGVPAVQFYSADSLRVQFGFVLDADRPLHLAVSAPRAAWATEVHAIESVLGTIQKSP